LFARDALRPSYRALFTCVLTPALFRSAGTVSAEFAPPPARHRRSTAASKRPIELKALDELTSHSIPRSSDRRSSTWPPRFIREARDVRLASLGGLCRRLFRLPPLLDASTPLRSCPSMKSRQTAPLPRCVLGPISHHRCTSWLGQVWMHSTWPLPRHARCSIASHYDDCSRQPLPSGHGPKQKRSRPP
jgi:hypothetical protein